MPRKRRQKQSKASSGHFTSVEIHQLRRKVMRASRVTAMSHVSDLLRLSRHLCQHCDDCWQAVEAISPPFKPSLGDPVTSAIGRLAQPPGWLVVTVEHCHALEEVRVRPYGFAYVVLEETLSHSLAQAMAQGSTAVSSESYRFWADHLLEELARTAGATPELADVTAFAACNEIEIHLMAGRIAEAQKGVDDVRDLLPSTTGQPFIEARALELRAHVHEAVRRFPQADECYQKAVDLLGPDRARRRFEVRVESVELLFRRKVSPQQLYVAFAGALAELPSDLGGLADPVERLYLTHDLARSTRLLAKMARDAGLRQWPGIPEALEALGEVWPLYPEHANPFVLEMAEMYRRDLKELAADLAPVSAN